MSRSTSHVYEPPAGPLDVAARAMHAPAPLMFDRDGIRAVDQAAIEEYGIPGIVLMENAARGLAEEAMRMIRADDDALPTALIICGSGNNGGDGYALARHLHNIGVEVAIATLAEPRAGTDARINFEICQRMDLLWVAVEDLDDFISRVPVDLIIDAIFGTGLDRPIDGLAVDVINWITSTKIPVLAVDLPSGIDCNTGAVLGVAVRANTTVTFVGPKIGFSGLDAQKHLGDVVIADIGAPRELAERFGTRIEPMPHPEGPDHDIPRAQLRRPGG